jgi:hypothetical protein
VPAAGLARDAGGAGYAAVLVAGVAASTLALVVVEYVALTRLVHAVTGVPVRTVSRLLVVLLTAAAAAAAIAPGRLSATLLRPSLVALWLALLVPVIGYPAFRRRFAALTLVDVAAAVVATALFGYGLLESFRAAST